PAALPGRGGALSPERARGRLRPLRGAAGGAGGRRPPEPPRGRRHGLPRPRPRGDRVPLRPARQLRGPRVRRAHPGGAGRRARALPGPGGRAHRVPRARPGREPVRLRALRHLEAAGPRAGQLPLAAAPDAQEALMGLLTPAFLAGLAALAVPVLVHLTNRPRSETVPFPSLMFLQRVPYRSVRRQTLRHWLLFALRAASFALLALAFARPFLGTTSAPAGPL